VPLRRTQGLRNELLDLMIYGVAGMEVSVMRARTNACNAASNPGKQLRTCEFVAWPVLGGRMKEM
jgi:hypothetical protein